MYWLKFKAVGKPAVSLGLESVPPYYSGCDLHGPGSQGLPLLCLPSFPPDRAGLGSALLIKEELAQAGALAFL